MSADTEMKIDYSLILKELQRQLQEVEARREALEAAIEGLDQLAGMESQQPDLEGLGPLPGARRLAASALLSGGQRIGRVRHDGIDTPRVESGHHGKRVTAIEFHGSRSLGRCFTFTSMSTTPPWLHTSVSFPVNPSARSRASCRNARSADSVRPVVGISAIRPPGRPPESQCRPPLAQPQAETVPRQHLQAL